MITIIIFILKTKKILFGSLLSIIGLFSNHEILKANELKIVALDGVLCDLTKTLVDKKVEVNCIIPPEADPHTFNLRPSDKRFISASNVIFHNGFNLTPSINKIPKTKNIVAVAEIALNSYSGEDPHVWHDPNNSMKMLKVITANLKSLLPEREINNIKERESKARQILNEIDNWAQLQFQTIPNGQKVLVTNHQAYSHLADRYQIKQITMLDSFTTGGVLRPSSLNKISSAITESGALTIFPEKPIPNKTLKRISKRTGVPISSNQLFPEGVAKGKSYVGTFMSNVCSVVNGQGGTCDKGSGDQLDLRWQNLANKN